MDQRDDRPQLHDLLREVQALQGAQRTTWLEALAQRDAAAAQRVVAALADASTQLGPGGLASPDLRSALDRAEPALAGLRLGAWVLQHKIGQGGMGEVWQARRADGLYQAEAAIKLLRSDLALVPLALRFARERAVLGRLNHPAIARLLDAGVAEQRAYLVLELVHGQPLAEHVRQHCPTVGQRVALLLRIAEAVDYAHAQLIVHRDLKPNNVMVTADGQAKLLDFGLAALLDDDQADTEGELTRQTGRGLTLGYAAPEQITGAATGTTADVFALGVMLFELLSGTLPFGQRHDNRQAAEHAVLHDEPHRLNELAQARPDNAGPGRPADGWRARGDLEAIAAKALRKRPDQRYANVQALIDDLQRWQHHRPVSARRDDWRHRSSLFLRRHAVLAGASALLTLTLAAGLAATTWQWRRAEAANRSSDAVTRYLTGLLASANPELHGGQVPSVLQLLDESRLELDGKFADDPATRQRLLEVLSRTYMVLNRFDHALPLGEQWLALARQRHDEDDPAVLLARLSLGQVHQIMGNHDAAIALLEPIGPALAKRFGADSEAVRQQQFVLAADYMHSNRPDDAQRALERVRVLTEQLHPGDEFEQADYLNNLGVLRRRQGRLAEALAVVRQTRPMWTSPNPKLALQVLVLRRAEITLQIDNGEFDGLAAEAAHLQGHPADELRLRQALVDTALRDGVAPATLLLHRAELLRAQVRSGQVSPAALPGLAQPLLAEAAALGGGARRGHSLLALVDAALAADHATLAADALAQLR
ncbi:MAG: hypothetical protein CFE45_14120, partial [Burkholderiales bacterium PBB5]